MDGAGGNDTLRGSGEPDILNGGSGFDTADYATSGGQVDIDLARNFQNAGDAQGDQLYEIENVTGSPVG